MRPKLLLWQMDISSLVLNSINVSVLDLLTRLVSFMSPLFPSFPLLSVDANNLCIVRDEKATASENEAVIFMLLVAQRKTFATEF